MKQFLIILVVGLAVFSARAGVVGLPKERIILPAKTGSYMVRVWDGSKEEWLGDFQNLSGFRYYDFQYPEWGKSYWIGLWNAGTGEFVFGKWVGQHKTDDKKQIIQ